jgi:hypothetical protein
VTNVSYTTGHPDLDLLTSDVAQLPGDSGGPLYTQGPTLVGIASSVNDATRGADAQPLESLEQEIKAGAGHYGRGFSVYISG